MVFGLWRSLPALLTLIVLTINVTGTGPIPDDDNTYGYLHVENYDDDPGVCWINAVQNDTESASSNHHDRIGMPFEGMLYNFTVKENPADSDEINHDLYMKESDSKADFLIDLTFYNGEPSEIFFQLYEDDNEIDTVLIEYQEDGEYISSFDIPGRMIIEEGHALRFMIRWDMQEGRTNEWVLYCNNRSHINFPIAPDSDDDGVPDYLDEPDDPNGDNDNNQTNDPPDDTDSNDGDDDNWIPGFEPILIVVALAVIIIKKRH